MAEMMHDAVEARLNGVIRKGLCQELARAFTFAAIAQALNYQRWVWAPPREEREFAPDVRPVVLIERDMVDLAQLYARLAKAVTDRLRWESGPMLDAPEALLLGRRDKHAVAQNAGGTIAVEGVQSQNDHGRWSPPAIRASSRPDKRRWTSSSAIMVSAISR